MNSTRYCLLGIFLTLCGCSEQETLSPVISPQLRIAGGHGRIIAFHSNLDGDFDIYTMRADGTVRQNLTDWSPFVESEPDWSPDGRRLVFSSNRHGSFDIFTMNASGENVQRLTADPSQETEASWSPDGSVILFQRNTVLFTVPGEGGVAQPLGNPCSRSFRARWSRDGTKVAFECGPAGDLHVFDLDTGTETNLTSGQTGSESEPTWSPDDQRIAFTSQQGGWNLFVVNSADGGNVTQLTQIGNNFRPDWSPDGNRMLFASSRDFPGAVGNSMTEVYVMNADGSNQTRLTFDGGIASNARWQPDPRSMDDCKAGGWAGYGFSNQGLCIRLVETGEDSR